MGLFKNATDHCNHGLLLAVGIVAVSSFNWGLDNQGFSTAQAMEPFIEQFGIYNSVIYAGMAVGVWIGSLVSGRWGRRRGLMALSGWVMIATIIILTSKSKWQILVGRVLFYVYLGMELAVIPVYQSEITPAPLRGFVLSTHQSSLLIGGLIMNVICLGTERIPNNNSWRIPFALCYVPALIVLVGTFFIAESPRWLLLKGRRDEALASLTRLREGKRSEEEILMELEGIEFSLENEIEQGSFKEIFQGVNLKRTMVAVGVNFFQEIMGSQIISRFGALMVQSIGTVSPFIITVVFALANIAFVAIAMTSVDWLGRRFFLIVSALMQTCALFGLGAIGTFDYYASTGLGAAAIVFLVVQTSGFSIGYAPFANVVMTEVVATHLRDPSQRVSATVRVVANFAVGFLVPYMMDALGLKLGFVFGPMCFVGAVWTWLSVPECSGKSLETIDRLFREGVALRKFSSYRDNYWETEHALQAMDKVQGETRVEEVVSP